MEIEDDVFFADLSKQISMLIMEDEEEYSPVNCSAPSIQAFSHGHHPISVPTSVGHEYAQRREIRGTGVFIPTFSVPRRKNRARKFTSFNPGDYVQQREKSRYVSSVKDSVKFASSYSTSKS